MPKAKKASRYEEEIIVKPYMQKNAEKRTVDVSISKSGPKKASTSAPKKKQMTQAQKDVLCKEGNNNVYYTWN